MKNIAVIYPNQLYELQYLPYDPNDIDEFIIIEDTLFFEDKERKLNFNMLKLIYQRACMKYYHAYLEMMQCPVDYLDWVDNDSNLFKHIDRKFGKCNLYVIDPVDHLLLKRIKHNCKKYNFNVVMYQSPGFLLSERDLSKYMNKRSKSHFYQYNFYTWHRKKSGILMNENGKPVGGKFSYDKYNRKSIPSKSFNTFVKTNRIKIIRKTYTSVYYDDAIKYCEKKFINHYPDLYDPNMVKHYPITHRDVKIHFKKFLEYGLHYFGLYEDAIDFDENKMFHSVISPCLNIGLLNPVWVVNNLLNHYDDDNDSYIDVEAFFRQLNWREYSRLLYIYAYDDIIGKNYFKNKRRITKAWYNASTGIQPLDDTIRMAFLNGYLHHIMRLMIVCNFMNLCRINPNDAYKWFMEFSLDSYDWVMINNVYSMGLYSDGGLTTTKPYISSSNYIVNMTNAKKDDHWNKIWNTLYYCFIHDNFDKLKGRAKIYQSHWTRQKNKDKILNDGKKIIIQLTKN